MFSAVSAISLTKVFYTTPSSCLVMVPMTLKAIFADFTLLSPADAYSRRRCAFGDKCWPDGSTWQAFNDSVSGHLIQSAPSAAACHHERYNAGLCDTVQKEWKNSLWRTNQTGGYSAILWELGSDQCFINTPRDAPCDAGLGTLLPPWLISRCQKLIPVPHYSIAVQGVEEVQKAVNFANERDLYLVVKNTGHSQ